MAEHSPEQLALLSLPEEDWQSEDLQPGWLGRHYPADRPVYRSRAWRLIIAGLVLFWLCAGLGLAWLLSGCAR